MWTRSIRYFCRNPGKVERNLKVCCNAARNDQIVSNNWKPALYSRHFSVKAQEINNDKKTLSKCNLFSYRTHTCGELRLENVGQKVTLCGWIQYVRLSKFILIRDSYGITQCMVQNTDQELELPLETVVKVEGTVISRPKDMINPDMATGEVEVVIDNLQVLNRVDNLPFNLRSYQKPKEQLRLQHRYIDLRFPEMQHNLRLRSSMLHNMRSFLIDKQFVEVETPTLFCRTPGGAREFVVPTHYSGLFYSLVQSPQQFKQMLMVGGIDRYFQVARCYRDESTRPDRQPEFTQLDIELSFTTLDDVLCLIEELLYATFLKDIPKPPFKRITYNYAIEKYGSDKPNLAHGMELKKLTNLFSENTTEQSNVYALPYTCKIGKLTSKYKDNIKKIRKKYDIKIILNENIPKEIGSDKCSNIKSIVGEDNDCIIAMGSSVEETCMCLGEIRELLVTSLKEKELLVKDSLEPLWIVDFPLFLKGENGLETCHHPFTAPHPDDLHLLESDPLKMRSLGYDLVLNGNEIGGGSVRIHDAHLQERILNILNLDSLKLTHFINALKSGCPPHAGIALGIDRLMTIVCRAESIRDVIAFPKSHEGKDPLSGAPNPISDGDKKYYHIM